MKRSDRLALVWSLVLVALGVGAAILYFTGWGAIIRNMAVLAGRGTTMTSLAKRTPFTPSPGAGVSEERLGAYLNVCRRIKPFGDKIDEWEAERARTVAPGTPSFKGGAAGLVEAFLGEFASALEAQRMGPAEFAWIGDRMSRAAGGASATDAASESDRVLYGKYRERLEATALGTHALKIARDFAR